MDEKKTLEPWKALLQIKIPILFVHGEKDRYVDYQDSVKYGNMVGTNIAIIKDAEHGFHDVEEHVEQAYKATVDFFLKSI